MLENKIWDSSNSIGIELFDKHHKNFTDIINMLIDVINKKDCKNKKAEVFHKLVFYAENYFIDEEMYFKQYNYSKTLQHKDSHSQLIEKISEFQKNIQDDSVNCMDMLNYIELWFNEHMLKYDKDAIDFLSNLGVK